MNEEGGERAGEGERERGRVNDDPSKTRNREGERKSERGYSRRVVMKGERRRMGLVGRSYWVGG